MPWTQLCARHCCHSGDHPCADRYAERGSSLEHGGGFCQYHRGELACPGGCVGGGGQPINMDTEAIKIRAKSLYNIDDNASIRVSHKNPDVVALYTEFLGEPLSHKSHKLLHTSYNMRKVIL